MGFFDKLKAAIRKIKGKLIVFGILVFVITGWLVMPFCVAKVNADIVSGTTFLADMTNGTWWSTFFKEMGEGLTSPWTKMLDCFKETYIKMFLSSLKFEFIICVFFILIGIMKAFPKHEYEDIENGSSDWCEGGEQYKVLHKHKGIVLAEKNYLPVDKRGNVNVLVVRRFWCW